ncbi:hypothetical protein AMS68_004698 [Peltaster fructicola]|uniref:MoaB/Mog domain-containing protein n=1 Tax=Peltaster fructicola TaxID=286661 RepID=A0A6H0XWZ1_9PEZI|nr:hypothetical protein AMS68_004698 [Peltaster fructicola]
MTTDKLRVAILIISDTASRDASTDKCIPVLKETFAGDTTTLDGTPREKWIIHDTKIVPDDVSTIQQAIEAWTSIEHQSSALDLVNLVITSGGTGFATADVTPEVTPFAMMARPVAGVRNSTIVITLPGSPKGAKENLNAVIKLLPHACQQAAGMNSRVLHVGGVPQLEKAAGIASAGSSGHHHHHHHGHSHGHGHAGPRAHTKPEDRPLSNDPSAGASRRYRESPYPMLPVKDALQIIAEHSPAPVAITATVNDSLIGHILAEDVVARENVPAFRASIVDGYAIIASKHVMVPSTKGRFPVVGVSHAKPGQMEDLQIGEVARITTGAPLPPGATSVVMVEDTVLTKTGADGKEEAEIEVLTDAIEPGENVREIGSDVKAGDVIMKKGEGISATGGEFGLLASVGTREVQVYRKPIVGVLSTGDEIVQHDRPGDLKLGEVRDTNRPTLLTSIRSQGFEAVDLGIASDAPGALEVALRDALRRVDVLVTSGGVSMGELDLLKPTIERQLGGTIHFGRVSMKPGKPTTFATVPFKDNAGKDITKMIFSLPGNPASAVVTFHLFVLPALHHFCAVRPAGLPKLKVVLEQDVRCDEKRDEYHRVVISVKSDGRIYASSTGGQRSSRIGSFKSANGLLCLPAQPGSIKKGETCDALLIARILGE